MNKIKFDDGEEIEITGDIEYSLIKAIRELKDVIEKLQRKL